MVVNVAETVAVPLRVENDIIYMANTRIPIDTVIDRYRVGDTPEEILEGFPTLKLEDIYFAISYYLANRAELDAYLEERDRRMEELRLEDERRNPTEGLRDRLTKRMEEKNQSSR